MGRILALSGLNRGGHIMVFKLKRLFYAKLFRRVRKLHPYKALIPTLHRLCPSEDLCRAPATCAGAVSLFTQPRDIGFQCQRGEQLGARLWDS